MNLMLYDQWSPHVPIHTKLCFVAKNVLETLTQSQHKNQHCVFIHKISVDTHTNAMWRNSR